MLGRLFIVNPRRQPVFPLDLKPDEHGLVALGGVLEPELLVEAYQKGIFPWTGEHPIPWYSPDPRMILIPKAIRVRRTLRQRMRASDYDVRFDHDFGRVIRRCATIERPGQDGTWITPNIIEAWELLHEKGLAHSVEVYDDNELVGGLYGMALGRGFFGESMFAARPDTSKIALVALCRSLEAWGFHFVDCQQSTAHLRRMGAIDVPRQEYLVRLERAVTAEDAWGGTAPGEAEV